MMLDGAAVLRLCDKVRGATGASVVALVAGKDAARAFFDENRLEFTSAVPVHAAVVHGRVEAGHLTRPVCVHTATERPLTVYACDMMDRPEGTRRPKRRLPSGAGSGCAGARAARSEGAAAAEDSRLRPRACAALDLWQRPRARRSRELAAWHRVQLAAGGDAGALRQQQRSAPRPAGEPESAAARANLSAGGCLLDLVGGRGRRRRRRPEQAETAVVSVL